MNDRDSILAAIRNGLASSSPRGPAPGDPPLPTAAQCLPDPGDSPDAWLVRFRQMSAELRKTVVETESEAAVAGALRKLAADDGWRRIAVAGDGLVAAAAASLALPLVETSGGYDRNDLESCDAAVTGCDALVAQTGSILLTSRSGGGRAVSVLPPHHVVVARRRQLLPDLPAAFDLLDRTFGPDDWPSMVAFVTGPSRTADIERILVLGAHGPRKLTVILAP